MESEVVYDEEGVIAFKDIDSKVPVPVARRTEGACIFDGEVGRLPNTVAKSVLEVAEKFGVVKSWYGFRSNNRSDADQEVFITCTGV